MTETNIKKSRSHLERLVERGLVAEAGKIMGRAFFIGGIVVDGNKIGRTLGYPTANIQPSEPDGLIPAQGVYIAFTRLRQAWYKSMVNIGVRPTLNLGGLTIEVHLFDFSQSIYNESVALHLVERLRDEMRFASLGELKHQLDIDSKMALDYFEKSILAPLPENDFVFINDTGSSN